MISLNDWMMSIYPTKLHGYHCVTFIATKNSFIFYF